MIGAVCYIADFETENLLNDFKVEASEKYHVGVTGGNIPRHISLGMPYEVPDWQKFCSYVEEFAKCLNPISVEVESMGTTCFPKPETGAFFVQFKEGFGLDDIRDSLKEGLKRNLNVEVTDNLKGKRAVALGCGTKGIECYQQYVDSLSPKRYMGMKLRFDQVGIFYYPEKNWDPSTYICYRRIKL